MAKQQSPGTSSTEVNAFSKGMQKDLFASLSPKEQWAHARNAANNSVDGDVGVIGNEPANLECAKVPYTIIGAIHTYADQWVIFSTDDESSEIGIFDDSKCEYETLVNDPCLNFNRKYLITGAAKENYDCTWQAYWDDSNNPSRTLNLDDIPWVQQIVSAPGSDCVLYEDSTVLDCERIRLAPLLTTPCVKLNKNVDGGQLRNGSYQAHVAYVLNDQKVTDYLGQSNVQALFDHDINGGSLDIEITNLDKEEFDQYELVILADNQGTKVATRIGVYSTEQTKVTLDFIDNSLPAVALGNLFLKTPAYEKSESMYVVNDYLIRQGPTEQFDFNYQPLANEIKSEWVVAEYNAEYYFKGGNKTQFMRDEIYPFFIRWVYNTGEKSASYHIPGKAPSLAVTGNPLTTTSFADLGPNSDPNMISDSGSEYNFQVFNTAEITAVNLSIPTGDGGTIIAKGDMAYWQSTEKYPATKPDIWGDLCGKEIRHHKFPTEERSSLLDLSAENGSKIRILGVQFNNIERPKYNNGSYIENIVGYEILRGSRQGNKSILAKGIFRNMRRYDIPKNEGNLGPSVGLYPNFPYNDLRGDAYHWDGQLQNSTNNGDWDFYQVDPLPRTDGCDNFQDSINTYKPLMGYERDVFTFHSPELMFRRPFLNPYEIRIYGAYGGESVGTFKVSEKHPQNKLLRNGAAIVAGIIGIGYAIGQMQGKQKVSKFDATNANAPWLPIWVQPAILGTNFAGFNPAAYGAGSGIGAGTIAANAALNLLLDESSKITDVLVAGGSLNDLIQPVLGSIQQGMGLAPGMTGGGLKREFDKDTDHSLLSVIYKLVLNVTGSRTHIAIGAQKIIDLLYNLINPEDFAFKYNSHGLFDSYYKTLPGSIYRVRNVQSNYIGAAFQTFNSTYKINNLFRPDTVVIQTSKDLPIPADFSAPIDNSRYLVGGDADGSFGETYIVNPNISQTKSISALYGALKFNFENQYGQLEGIKQVQMSNCIFELDPDRPSLKSETTPIFSGDTYVGRWTEKVIMPIFTDFLYGQPDQYPYNYLQRINIPYPRFWMDTRKYDTTELAKKMTSIIGSGSSDAMPNDLFYLDRGDSCGVSFSEIFDNKKGNGAFAMRYGYMYTHCNGILDFFVESEVNLPQRDWEDIPEGRYYDPHRKADIGELFHAEIQKKDNTYKYDYSLSTSRFVTNLTSSGSLQPRDYNPEIAETCFTNYPKRLIYSLQAQEESKKDFWRVFLPNNYKDFKDRVNVIKPINKSGAIIFFPYQSPQMFQGLDQLQTDLGTKLTLGDGGLFTQAMQNLVNSDLSNEYGSCESQRGVMNTPMGFFFISQAQGKIFQQGGQGLTPISNQGMKWWFNKYLPSNLIKQFPELEFSKLSDNPVVGIGCQVAYDITDDIAYFCKKDFTLKEEWIDSVIYDSELDCFTYNGLPPSTEPPVGEKPDSGGIATPRRLEQQETLQPVSPISGSKRCIEIGDPLYFDDCSWTVSYDPKAKAWISFHDWHPELNLSSINHFLTTQTKTTDIPQCPPGFTYNSSTEMCERLIDTTENAIVSVIDTPFDRPNICPEGFVYNELTLQCEKITTTPINCEPTIYDVCGGTQIFGNYGAQGTKFFEPVDPSLPLPIRRASGNIIQYQDSTQLNEVTSVNSINNPTGYNNIWKDRLNLAGVWGNDGAGGDCPEPRTQTFGITREPTQQWIGFTTCIQIPETKVYSVFIAADNRTRFTLNGELIVDFGTSAAQANFQYGWVFPLNLTAGTNILQLEGYNDNAVAAFAAEVYDATVAQLASFTDITQLNAVKVFSTESLIGSGAVFDLGEEGLSGCNCPEGFLLSNCGGELQCVQIETADPILECDCPDENGDGIPDGTLVYYNSVDRNFTSPDGDCVDKEVPPPICRVVECICPPGPDPDAIVIQSGECDDIYQAGPNGNPFYQNPNPRKCTYKLLEQVEPSFVVGGIWRHNYRCDLFANYYDVDYPWEVELIESTGQNVNTVRSVEYQLESYVYKGDQFNACGDDRWHDLDYNFDEAIIYNTEQVSGLLRLELDPKEDPLNILTYPIINANDIQILYSKVEQKYRFNQFWDVTDDRGEFTTAERNILITQCNGYIRELNESNLNYNKAEDQRKKFRHYYNKVLLRRNLSSNRKMLLKLVNSKLNLSFR